MTARRKPVAKRKVTARPSKPSTPKRIDRTTEGVRDMLFDELDLLRSGQITPQRAKITAALVGQIVSTSKLDMDYARFLKSHDGNIISEEIRPLKLG